jgi:two-component system CheB/CheR fusion protein
MAEQRASLEEIHQTELELQNEELTAARVELEKSLRRSMHLFEFAPIGYAILSPDGTIRAINQVGAQLLLRERGELIDRRWAVFVSLRDRVAFSDWAARVHDDAERNSFEFELLLGDEETARVDGEAPIIRLTAKSLLEDDPAILIAFEDVTLQRKAEAKLRAAEKELREADRRKDEFFGVLSHELRTPLSIVLLYSQLMQCERFDAAKIREMAFALERSAKMQRRLIDDLLDISRIVAGKFDITREAVDVGTVVRDSLEAIRPDAQTKQLDLCAHIGTPLSPIRGDAQRLQQAVTNLLSNAVKFSFDGGRVELRVEPSAQSVQIQVSDHGAGFEPAQSALLFERFWQADRSPTRSVGGLGLGLSIARSIIEAHHGTLGAASVGPGHGSTFTILLPIEEGIGDAGALHMRGGERTNVALRGRRILIVEDDPKTREALRALFESVEAEVRTAEDSARALLMYDGFRPEIMVCDVAMPGEDGCSLLRRIRALSLERGGQVPAIALTALAGNEDKLRTRASGFQKHLAKPVDIHELLVTASALLHELN